MLIHLLEIVEIPGMGSQNNNIRHSFIHNRLIGQVLDARYKVHDKREMPMINKLLEHCIGCLNQI